MIHEVPLPGGFAVSDDKARLDIGLIHRFLAEESYWARGRPRALVERAIAHTLTLGLYAPDGRQAGFATIVTDRTISAHLRDVFVLPEHRGLGLGAALVRAALAHPELATVRRWTLNTDDAHGLYAKLGFIPVPPTGAAMQLLRGPGDTPP